jgi:hypothetical protein
MSVLFGVCNLSTAGAMLDLHVDDDGIVARGSLRSAVRKGEDRQRVRARRGDAPPGPGIEADAVVMDAP